MYYDFFGLDKAPFKLTSDINSFYLGGGRGAILDALYYAIINGDVITKVIGEVGSGKTMLCRKLASRLPDNIEVIYLANPSLSPDNILHAIAFELGLEQDQKKDRLTVMKQLEAYLLEKHSQNRQVVVFVEEAQAMPVETLEEIRFLTNLETREHKLLQIVLFGQPELDNTLAKPHIRQLKERITHTFYLPPLKRHEILDYLMFRLASAGYRGADVFSKLAVRLIAMTSKGLMRRINILAEKAMLAAFTQGARRISLFHVMSAIRDSEFSRTKPANKRLEMSFPLMGLIAALLAWSIFSHYNNGEVVTTAAIGEAQAALSESPIAVHKNSVAAPSDIDLFEQRLNKTSQWLNSSNPRHFTIQLLLTPASEKGALTRLLESDALQTHRDKLFIYPATVQNQKMFNLLYGEFNNYADAQQSLHNLPAELKDNQPFLRNVRQVFAEWKKQNNES